MVSKQNQSKPPSPIFPSPCRLHAADFAGAEARVAEVPAEPYREKLQPPPILAVELDQVPPTALAERDALPRAHVDVRARLETVDDDAVTREGRHAVLVPQREL